MAFSRDVRVNVVGDSSSLEKTFAKSTAASKKFGKDMGNVGSTAAGLDKTFGRLRGGIAGAFVGSLAVGGTISGLRKLSDAASDLNEQQTKNVQVFGRSSAALEAWSKTTAGSLGISQRAALEATGTFGNLFSAIGIGSAPAADMSKRLVQLASDMASFNNADPSEVLLAIRSGLTGEAEPLRRFGVLLSEARVQQVAMAESGKKTAKELTNQEKAAARYNIILQDTKKAQGDFARTSGGLANQQRILTARWEDAQATLGQRLLPAMIKVTEAANAMLGSLNNMADATDLFSETFRNKLADAFGVEAVRGILDAAGPALDQAMREFEDSIDPFNINVPVVFTPQPGKGKGPKGFGSGLKPSDLFGPLIKEIPAALEEALLDAERSQDPRKIKSVLQRILSVMTEALDDPRLKREGRIKIKTIINSIQSQIQSQDNAIQAGVDKATKARTDRANKAKTAAKNAVTKQRQGFADLFDRLSLKLDAAEATAGFADDRRAAVALQVAIGKQIEIEGRTPELLGKLAAARDKEREAIQKQEQARQFRALGLTAEGDEPIPGLKNLAKRINQALRNDKLGKIDITSKFISRLKAARKLIKTEGGKLTAETRDVINDLIKAATGEDSTKTKSKGPLTKTSALNVGRILDGLGLSRDAEKELRSRLSSFNSAGLQLAGKTGTAATGRFVSPVVVQSSVTVTLDGDVVGRAVTRSQQKAGRRNPPQRRGPNARSGV